MTTRFTTSTDTCKDKLYSSLALELYTHRPLANPTYEEIKQHREDCKSVARVLQRQDSCFKPELFMNACGFTLKNGWYFRTDLEDDSALLRALS